MTIIHLTGKRLLGLLQTEFPLVEQPYVEIGRKLGVSAPQVMDEIAGLRAAGIIRQIGPVMDARRLGFKSTLVAAQIDARDLPQAEKVIAAHPGVSHGYEREHRFNVWFTLAVSPQSTVQEELEGLGRATGAVAMCSLPALKVYKIGAYFDVEGDDAAPVSALRPSLGEGVELKAREKATINAVQQDLPLSEQPFSGMAAEASLSVKEFLAVCRDLLHKGVIRRFSASINHRQAGFTANAMTCWAAPARIIDSAGRRLADLKEVSHCYERETNAQWPYNLFAMIHGHSLDETRAVAGRVSGEVGLGDYLALLSTREFKKARVVYRV